MVKTIFVKDLLSQYICLFLCARVLTERTNGLCSLFARRARTQGYIGLASKILDE